jgi:ribose 5-phosphate isomerase B
MKIAFGCDHAGYAVKEAVIGFLQREGHTVLDCGCASAARCDYPDFAVAVAEAVAAGTAERGVLVCGTGIGMAITANKVPGIRAAVCWNDDVAGLASEHNAANILCLGARCAQPQDMIRWIARWLATRPAQGERHQQRLDKIARIETRLCGGAR